jgi:ribosomal protein L11 methyltransferase
MKKYYKVDIYISDIAFDPIIGFLSQFNNSGFLEEEDCITCYIDFNEWNNEILNELKTFINNLRGGLNFGEYRINVDIIEEENWNKEWEKSIEPIEINEKIIIKPTWKDYPEKPGQIIIQIDPKMAFGTGHHETTRLSILALERYITAGCDVLDMGTGTGIIAIAAVKIGAKSALGIDNDDWAYENALENIKLNQAENNVKILLGSHKDIQNKNFDVIISNIDFKTNYELIDIYPDFLSENGVIILSGLLMSDFPEMKNKILKNNLKIVEELKENDWGCLIVKIK